MIGSSEALQLLYEMYAEATGDKRNRFTALEPRDSSIRDGHFTVLNQATSREEHIPESALRALRRHGMIEYRTRHELRADFTLTDRGIQQGKRMGRQ